MPSTTTDLSASSTEGLISTDETNVATILRGPRPGLSVAQARLTLEQVKRISSAMPFPGEVTRVTEEIATAYANQAAAAVLCRASELLDLLQTPDNSDTAHRDTALWLLGLADTLPTGDGDTSSTATIVSLDAAREGSGS